RGQEEREEAGLEQESVPLEPEEVPPHRREREVERPAAEERRRGRDADQHQQRECHPRSAQRVERAIAGVEPRERGEVPVADRAVVSGYGLEVIARGQDAVATHQAYVLDPER